MCHYKQRKGAVQKAPLSTAWDCTTLFGLLSLSFCFKVNLWKKQKQDQCTVYECHGQLVFSLNTQTILPENAPVRLASAQLEELDYRKLYRTYSSKGRKSAVEPRVMFKAIVYGYLCGIYSSRKLEEACRYRVDFMWLLENQMQDMKAWKTTCTWILPDKLALLSLQTMTRDAAKSSENKLAEWKIWSTTQRKIILLVCKAAAYRCGRSVPNSRTDRKWR